MLNNNVFTVFVDWNRCSGEGTCTKICPVDVFELHELKDYPETLKSVPVNEQNCTFCMKCVPACVEQAISVKKDEPV